MEVIESKKTPELTVPPFRMTDEEFLSIIKTVARETDEIQLTTGSYLDNRRYVLTDLDDLEKNRSKISSPLTFRINSIKLNINRIHSQLTFEEKDRSTAEELHEHLKHYKIWYSFIGNPFLALALVFPAYFYISFGKKLELIQEILLLFAVGSPIFFLSFLTHMGHLAPKVIFRPNDTFLKRNKDKIILAVLSLAAGIALNEAVPFIKSMVNADTPKLETHQN
ncbi:hypothetical protein [Ruegeria sp. PrR005]|uniref:Uncharacterized protein n=1 Tax=Ruegeria sp. PrR005 TaxID=2706882 RepID=A0A6B2NVJ0_9RHOB|nr:hypothetical protein [Ruegeria sp. PrR005]NDW47458.1 hypothetical protein [Ruegeria sp. PrR005]